MAAPLRRIVALSLFAATGAFAAPRTASFLLKAEMEGAKDSVRALAFTADSKKLLAGDDSANLAVFDVETRKLSASIDTKHKSLNAIAVAPKGGLVATTGKDGFVRMWDLASGRIARGFKVSGDPLFALAFDASASQLAAGGEDKSLRVYDAEEGLLQVELKGHDDTVRSVAFVDGGRGLLSCASDKTLRLWDLQKRRETRNQVERAAEYGDLQGFAVAPAGGAFVTLAHELKRAEGGIRTIGGRGGSALVEENPLILRDLASWSELAHLTGHLKKVNAAAFSPEGDLIASVSDDQSLIVWDREAEAKLSAFDLPDKQLAVAFSPDGKWLAAAGDDKKVRLYSVKRPEPEKPVAQAEPQKDKPEAESAKPAPSDAKSLYDLGRREFNLGHYAQALPLFEEAYKKKPLPRLLYNIGQCQRLLGNLEAAKRVYRSFISESSEDEPMIPKVEEKIAEIDAALAAQTAARESAPRGLADEKEKAPKKK